MDSRNFKNKMKGQTGKSLFTHMEELMDFFPAWDGSLPIKILPKVLFLLALGIFYIGNTHEAEKTIRKINDLEGKVEDLRADYITLKADYMFSSKQSSVASRVDSMGLEEPSQPPVKIVIEEK